MSKGHQCGLNGFTESLYGCFLSGPTGGGPEERYDYFYLGLFVFLRGS